MEDKFNINLNQNLWGLVVCYASLGAAEHWCLRALFWLSFFASLLMTVSVLVTTGVYTWNYWLNKVKK